VELLRWYAPLMGKRKRPPLDELSRTAPRSTPFNNPFGALSGLCGELPGQPAVQPRLEAPTPEAGPAPGLEMCGKLVVQRERKGRAGKTVTRISGLPPELIHEVAPQLKAALGCGATVESDGPATSSRVRWCSSSPTGNSWAHRGVMAH